MPVQSTGSCSPTAPHYTLDISPDSRSLVFATGNKYRICALPSGNLSDAIDTGALVRWVRFDPTGTKLALALANGQIQIRSLEDGKLLNVIQLSQTTEQIAWHPNGWWLGVACGDSKIRVYDALTGKIEAESQGRAGSPIRLTFSHGGNWLVSGGWDGTVRFWETASGNESLRVPGFGMYFGIGANDDCVTFGGGSRVTKGRLETGHECQMFIGPSGDTRYLSVDFSPDGTLVTGANEQGVRVFDSSSGQSLAMLAVPKCRTVLFTPDGRSLITGGPAGLQQWFVPSFRHANENWDFGQPTQLAPTGGAAALTPDGQSVIFNSGGDSISRVELANPGQLAPIGVHPGFIRYISVSPDGRWAASMRASRAPFASGI